MLEEDKMPNYFWRMAVQRSRTDVYFWFQMFFNYSKFRAKLELEEEVKC